MSPKCRFPAFPCDHGYEGLLKGDCFPCGTDELDRPCGDMGYYSNESPARGQLYLMTREEEPFCAHQYQIKVYNSRSERSAKSYGKLQVNTRDEFNSGGNLFSPRIIIICYILIIRDYSKQLSRIRSFRRFLVLIY